MASLKSGNRPNLPKTGKTASAPSALALAELEHRLLQVSMPLRSFRTEFDDFFKGRQVELAGGLMRIAPKAAHSSGNQKSSCFPVGANLP
jgi:hypothetical protein